MNLIYNTYLVVTWLTLNITHYGCLIRNWSHDKLGVIVVCQAVIFTGGHHSSMVSSAPTILQLLVWVPNTTFTLFRFMWFKMSLYLSFRLECEKNESKQKEARIGPFFFKKTSELLHNTLWLSHTELVTRLFFNILCSIPDGEVSFGKSPNSIVVVSWQAFTFLLDEKWCKECQRERKNLLGKPVKKLMKNWSFFTKYFIVCYAQKIQKAYSFLVYTFKNAQSRTRCQKQILTQHNMLCRNKALWLEVPRDKGSFNQLECPDSFFLFSSFQQLKDNNMFYKISLYKYLSC